MDTNSPRSKDYLSDIERRLEAWRPGTEGLDGAAMLFAAGVAAGRSQRARFLIPALCGLFAALAAAAVFWGWTERVERMALAGRIQELATTAESKPMPFVSTPLPSYEPSPDDYFHLRLRLERDPNHWLTSIGITDSQPLIPPPDPAIYKVRPRNGIVEP